MTVEEYSQKIANCEMRNGEGWNTHQLRTILQEASSTAEVDVFAEAVFALRQEHPELIYLVQSNLGVRLAH